MHRVLVVGAPASGKAWLAQRIRALTGMPVREDPGSPPAGDGAERPGSAADGASHEWIAIARSRERAAECLPRADLVVLVHTPRLLRDARVALAWITSMGRTGFAELRRSLAATHRYDADELPGLRELLRPHAARVMECNSSEDVRAVLERVFGITPDA